MSAGIWAPDTGRASVSASTPDAVVAIVSEETGAISVAVGGMLKRHLSLETLERLLRNGTDSFGGTGDRKTLLVCIPASEEGGAMIMRNNMWEKLSNSKGVLHDSGHRLLCGPVALYRHCGGPQEHHLHL